MERIKSTPSFVEFTGKEASELIVINVRLSGSLTAPTLLGLPLLSRPPKFPGGQLKLRECRELRVNYYHYYDCYDYD